MRIYLCDYKDGVDPLKSDVWVIWKSPPDIPYIELEVKVVEQRKKIKFFGFLKRSS